MTSCEVRKAIDDISLIKRILNQADEAPSKAAIKLRMWTYVFSTLATLCILVQEFLSGQANRDAFLYSSLNSAFMMQGLCTVAIMLLLFCLALVFLVLISAKDEQSNYQDFIKKNFTYLKGIGFFSDLLIKFIIFAMLIIAAKGDWVGGLFLIFLADYCFQGRFFKMPFKLELIFGVISLLLAGFQFQQGSSSLLPALSLCLVLSLSSLIITLKDLIKVE